MSDWKARAIKEYQFEVDRLTRHKEVLANLPDELPFVLAYVFEYCIVGYLPYDQEVYNKAEEMLENNGWAWVEEHDARDGSHIVTFTKGGHELKVYLDPTKEGSKCKRVQVGVEEWPVYEVRCVSAAA